MGPNLVRNIVTEPTGKRKYNHDAMDTKYYFQWERYLIGYNALQAT